MEEITITHTAEQLKTWQNKELSTLWRKQYPDIFDEDDSRLATSQPSRHFGEWCAAVYFANQGYKVLVEKYHRKSHKRKWCTISNLLTEKQIKSLTPEEAGNQPPDLFVYKGKEFFFVEVKRIYPSGGHDILKPKQQTCFENIEKRFKSKIVICEVRQSN